MQPIGSSPPSGPATAPASGGSAIVETKSLSNAPASAPTPTREQIDQAVATANRALKAASSSLEFAVDQSTGKTIVRVVDTGNQQVIRQFPSEEMLSIVRAIDRLQGFLLNDKA